MIFIGILNVISFFKNIIWQIRKLQNKLKLNSLNLKIFGIKNLHHSSQLMVVHLRNSVSFENTNLFVIHLFSTPCLNYIDFFFFTYNSFWSPIWGFINVRWFRKLIESCSVKSKDHTKVIQTNFISTMVLIMDQPRSTKYCPFCSEYFQFGIFFLKSD